MSGYIQGQTRGQITLFPDALDDFIDDNSPARIIDVFVDELNLESLGFKRTEPKSTGRPGYHPATLLKIYIYGYLNRIQSSRRLEVETRRNIELMWLTERLSPDFKTIADFRKDNSEGIKNTCAYFIKLCRKLKLLENSIVAVDGSKFKAVNSRDKNFTPVRIKTHTERIERQISDYLTAMDDADKTDKAESTLILSKKVAALRKRLSRLKDIDKAIKDSPANQISFTDPDARAMKVRRSTATVGYNVQTAVDTHNHLIAAHFVSNEPMDRGLLCEIGEKAQQALGKKNITVLADKGYFSGPSIKRAQDKGMIPLVPKPDTSGSAKKGIFNRRLFKYDSKTDSYLCPAGKTLPYKSTYIERGLRIRAYLSRSTCQGCSLWSNCTTSKKDSRRIRRWEHEHRLEEMESQLQALPNSTLLRKQTVEHPFGTIKSWMGSTHFLTRGLKNVSSEMSLNVLAYNFKRVIALIGKDALMAAIKA